MRKHRRVTLVIPDERGAPIRCALCGRVIAGLWENYMDTPERSWSWQDHAGVERVRHDRCEI